MITAFSCGSIASIRSIAASSNSNGRDVARAPARPDRCVQPSRVCGKGTHGALCSTSELWWRFVVTTSQAAPPPPLSTREVWNVIPVRRLLISNAVLYSGIALQSTALLKQAFDITGRESDLGWMGLAEFLPIFLLVLVTGSVADHFNRKGIALITVGFEVITSGALLFYARTNPTSVMPLFVIAFAFGIARAFQAPAMRAMPPMVAPDGSLPKVIALYSAVWTGAIIVGPALGGFLYAVDPWVAYLGASSLIFISFLVLSTQTFLRQPLPPDPDKRPTLAHGSRGSRLHPSHTGAVRCDRARPVRGPVRRSGGIDPRDRQGPARCRRRRLRMAARRARFRRGSDGHLPRGATRPPSRRQDAAVRRRRVRARDTGARHDAQLLDRVPRARRALGRRHGQRVHPWLAGAVGDARREARQGVGGRVRLHRRVERVRARSRAVCRRRHSVRRPR